MNKHSPRYIYNQMNTNLHQKDTERQLFGASCIYIEYITIYENEACGFAEYENLRPVP